MASVKPQNKWSDNELASIRHALDNFYATVDDYTAFSAPSDQKHCWSKMLSAIEKQRGTSSKIRILEVGGGRSGFGLWLTQLNLRDYIEWTVHDVTNQNADWLQRQADYTVFGDVGDICDTIKFDIIFSTFVLEHVSDPENHLNCLLTHLAPYGHIFLFSPCYDVPGYFCPSARHLSIFAKTKLFVQFLYYRSIGFITRQPQFLIQNDLAAFHKPFFTDSDAVHWVSKTDIQNWAKSKGAAKVRTLKIGTPALFSKDWIVKRFLVLAIEVVK